MVTWLRNHPDHISNPVFYHGLIKLSITTELEKIDRSWKHFTFWFGFDPEAQMHDDEEIRKQYRRQKIKVAEGGNEQAKKVFDSVNMSTSEVSRTEV